MIGTGRQHGPLRLDYGDGWADLQCDLCGAGWTGIIDDPCTWCEAADARQLRHQIELTTTPPDLDAGDIRYAAAMRAWAKRMATAVEAGIITRAQAENAWKRGRNGASSTTAA